MERKLELLFQIPKAVVLPTGICIPKKLPAKAKIKNRFLWFGDVPREEGKVFRNRPYLALFSFLPLAARYKRAIQKPILYQPQEIHVYLSKKAYLLWRIYQEKRTKWKTTDPKFLLVNIGYKRDQGW